MFKNYVMQGLGLVLHQAWYAEFLLKILLRKTGARLNFKIALLSLHIYPGHKRLSIELVCRLRERTRNLPKITLHNLWVALKVNLDYTFC
jgi:hypothetical protein